MQSLFQPRFCGALSAGQRRSGSRQQTAMATIRTRKFMSNRLLGRKQFVSDAADMNLRVPACMARS